MSLSNGQLNVFELTFDIYAFIWKGQWRRTLNAGKEGRGMRCSQTRNLLLRTFYTNGVDAQTMWLSGNPTNYFHQTAWRLKQEKRKNVSQWFVTRTDKTLNRDLLCTPSTTNINTWGCWRMVFVLPPLLGMLNPPRATSWPKVVGGWRNE